MARSNHRAGSVIDRLEGWPLSDLTERLSVGSQDLIADAIVKFSLLL